MMNTSPQQIIEFWFSDRIKNQWFSSTPELDKEIFRKYGSIFDDASIGMLDDWMNDPEGCLALIILLDQFPLNMFRDQAKSFQTERKAIEVAFNAINNKYDQKLERDKRVFLYMPFMHSENLSDQDMSVRLYTENRLEANIGFAEHHREIIRKFGRFPHRNKILKRESTDEEKHYLASKNAFKG